MVGDGRREGTQRLERFVAVPATRVRARPYTRRHPMPNYFDYRQKLARTLLRGMGWSFASTASVSLPDGELAKLPPKFITFGEPHTHLADFPLMLLFFAYYRLPKVAFPVSDAYFNLATRHALKRLGAFPVDTEGKNNLVAQLIERMNAEERMILHIPPSGRRKKTSHWRSGFYHIALACEVPIVPAYLDGPSKTFGYGDPIYMTGDVSHDMDQIRAFYEDKRGITVGNESVIRLKAEDLQQARA